VFDFKEKTITSEEYEWNIHGLDQVSEVYQEIADNITSKYEYITKMTLGSFCDYNDVKTDPFRKSIISYIEFLHGYEHLDFDYKQMGNLLPQDFRLAIKTMACLPQDLNFHLINKIPIEFKTYEVCHASLLIMEAKF